MAWHAGFAMWLEPVGTFPCSERAGVRKTIEKRLKRARAWVMAVNSCNAVENVIDGSYAEHEVVHLHRFMRVV